jgi:thiol-disulfide isomerase/thioredoxin
MKISRRELLYLGSAGLAAALGGLWLAPRFLGRSGDGSALASASFPDLEGRLRPIADWRGRVAVCNFWATWCGPCREEIPMLVSTREAWLDKGIEIVGISIDKEQNVRQFAKELQISYPLLLGDVGAVDLLRRLGNSAGALPYTVILDRSGRVAVTKLGEIKREELEGHLGRLTAG